MEETSLIARELERLVALGELEAAAVEELVTQMDGIAVKPRRVDGSSHRVCLDYEVPKGGMARFVATVLPGLTGRDRIEWLMDGLAPGDSARVRVVRDLRKPAAAVAR